MSVSGYCWTGDERDDWDDSGADHGACLPADPGECDCSCHDWDEQDYDEMNARLGAFDMAPGQ